MIRLAVVALLVPLALTGCRQGMYDDARYEPYEKSSFFADGSSARPLPAGTVARGMLAEDRLFATGVGSDGAFAASPLPVTRELLDRGRERYDIYCAACHDRVGSGNGMIVQRGYTRPPSYHEDRLRQIADGHLFDVMTRGYGVMPSYASQVTPEDRWAIVAYVRALQLSQDADPAALPVAVRELAQRALAVRSAAEPAEGDSLPVPAVAPEPTPAAVGEEPVR